VAFGIRFHNDRPRGPVNSSGHDAKTGVRRFLISILLAVLFSSLFSLIGQTADTIEPQITTGLNLMRSGNFGAAAAAFREALKVNPASDSAHYNLALALVRLHQPAEAIEHLKSVIASNPKSVIARYNLGILLEQQGRFSDAVEQFQAVAQLQPDDAAVLVHLVYNYFRLGKSDEALKLADETLIRFPDNRIRAQLGVVLLENRRYTEAVAPLEQARAAAPDSAAMTVYLARAYQGAGKIDRAIDVFREASGLNPDDDSIRFNLGRLLLQSQPDLREEDGVREIEAAIRLSPRKPEYYETLGRWLLERRHLDRASSVLKKGVEQIPASVDLQLMLGMAEAELHGAAAAQPYIEKAIALDPRAPLGYNLLGNVFLRVGDYDRALVNYRKAFELASANGLYCYDVALVLERMNKIAEAVPYAEKSVSLDPNRGSTHYILGKLLAKLGKSQEAIAQLEESVRLNPQSEASYYLLGRTYMTLGKQGQADEWNRKLNELKASKDKRIGLAGPASDAIDSRDLQAVWSNPR
jgi:tetratricopeptide (TPR) repeat protein